MSRWNGVRESIGKSEQKYNEYKSKLNAWARLFEKEYGAPPTDDDCQQSSTWSALNEKSRFYRKLMSGGGAERERDFAGSPRRRHESAPGFRSSSRRDGQDVRRPASRRESPSHYRSERKSHRRPHEPSPSGGRKSRRDNEKSERRSPDIKRSGGRGKNSRVESRSASRRTTRDEKGPVEALPPLPDASGAVKGKSEFTSAQSRAKEALEKLKKWERAFERDHGGSPTAEDMSSSNTFSSYKRENHGLPEHEAWPPRPCGQRL
jgi:hypothetical protein